MQRQKQHLSPCTTLRASQLCHAATHSHFTSCCAHSSAACPLSWCKAVGEEQTLTQKGPLWEHQAALCLVWGPRHAGD